jgi:hypothetical protein
MRYAISGDEIAKVAALLMVARCQSVQRSQIRAYALNAKARALLRYILMLQH